MNDYKKEFSFLDKEGIRARISAEITHRNGYPEFTASATYKGSAGQCLDEIKPATPKQVEFIELWRNYHLTDVSRYGNFNDHLDGIISVIEYEEQERQAKEQEPEDEDARILKLMEEEGIDKNEIDACKAYLEAGISDTLEDFEESYQGQFDSDEVFVKQLLEDTGAIPQDLPSYLHIDWEATAREIMMDYTEQDGFYFRNL